MPRSASLAAIRYIAIPDQHRVGLADRRPCRQVAAASSAQIHAAQPSAAIQNVPELMIRWSGTTARTSSTIEQARMQPRASVAGRIPDRTGGLRRPARISPNTGARMTILTAGADGRVVDCSSGPKKLSTVVQPPSTINALAE